MDRVVQTVEPVLNQATIHVCCQILEIGRIASNGNGVAWFEWLVLFLGAVCVICFCWLFGLQNEYAHLLMTSTVAIIIGAMLVLLFELQYPFRIDIGIGGRLEGDS